MRRDPVRALAAASLLFIALPGLGGEGRIPIYEVPLVVTQSGSYVVTRDLVGPAGTTLIDIQGKNIDIDLNGFLLEMLGNSPNLVEITGSEDVTIRNGSLRGGGKGISATDTIGLGLEDLRIIESHDTSIRLDNVTNFAIRRNHIQDSNFDCIRIDPGTGPGLAVGTVEDNLLDFCHAGGIMIAGMRTLTVVRNQVRVTTQGAGISINVSAGGLIAENTLENCKGGIRMANTGGMKLVGNVVRTADARGIYLDDGADDNFVLNNIVTNSSQAGLYVLGARNHLDRNVLNLNGAYGMHLVGRDNVFGRNSARGNTPATCSGPSTTDWCDETGSSPSFGDNYMPTLF